MSPSSNPPLRAGQGCAKNQYNSVSEWSKQVYEPLDQDEEEDDEEKNSRQPKGNNITHGSSLNTSLHISKTLDLPQTSPIIQGILLVPVTQLPDRFRGVFPFPTFNAVQSACFADVYDSNNNFVLASPTGSGKTAVLELAICHAIANRETSQYKIVYQAPTKALCAERRRDWQAKFKRLDIDCVELTGDSDTTDLRDIQAANIIVTTPEKWDSITRKWKDHEKLMRLISLFLIDEVHILKEDRGATLEAVVSRMKTIGTEVRFVALSATVPNFRDVATWLGKSAAVPYEPAVSRQFGEEFRPVKLRKHVCGYNFGGNDFQFDKFLDSKLLEVIKRYSERKPIMVFCATRASAMNSAKSLAQWWMSQSPRDRQWTAPQNLHPFQSRELRECATSGVAFHHAGLNTNDRLSVESGFLKGNVQVICCTSTLAVGINLPCHLVIIKNTVAFSGSGPQEYADVEIMQMLGRAGRPQFDNSALAVIMTRQTKAHRYEKMVSGEERLESRLHLNLIDHLNAEVGLGTIHDLTSAKKWLTGTFLYVRLKQNLQYYQLDVVRSGKQINENLDDIFARDITLLQDNNLITEGEIFRCTDFGDCMTKYYVHFDTMCIFMRLPQKASISEIVSLPSQNLAR